MDELERSIIKTYEYGRNFGVEYTTSDIKERLISKIVYNDVEIDSRLKNLTEFKNSTNKKNKINKVKKAKELGDLLGNKFKDILFVGVTGSVAAGYPKIDSDIDLMIVTKKNRLWLTRLGLRLFILIKQIPHRRYGKNERKDEFCFNLWLEEVSLFLPKNKQTLKNAMDSILMIPILNNQHVYEQFMKDNQWIGDWVATGYYKKISNLKFQVSKNRKKNNFLLDWLNWVLFWPQWWYMKRRIAGGLVDIKRAFFHPSDRIRYAQKDSV